MGIMQCTELLVANEVGLHARPAALFVKEALKFESNVRLRNLTTGGEEWEDAKSILGVLSLGVNKDHVIEVRAEGPDEEEAIAALSKLVRSDFKS
jgi:phosphocarrier protein HPr